MNSAKQKNRKKKTKMNERTWNKMLTLNNHSPFMRRQVNYVKNQMIYVRVATTMDHKSFVIHHQSRNKKQNIFTKYSLWLSQHSLHVDVDGIRRSWEYIVREQRIYFFEFCNVIQITKSEWKITESTNLSVKHMQAFLLHQSISHVFVSTSISISQWLISALTV